MPILLNSLRKWLSVAVFLCLEFALMGPKVHAQSSECDASGGAEDSQELKACKRFSCQARKQCDGAKNAASNKNDSDAQQVSNQYKGKNQVADPAFAMSGLGKRSADLLGQASAYCRGLSGGAGGAAQSTKQADKTCRSECDPGKIKATAKDAQKQKQEMQKERESCVSSLEQTAQGLDQGKADNQKAQEEAQKTGELAKNDQGQQKGGEQGKKEDQPEDKSGTPQSKPEEKTAQKSKASSCTGADATSKECTSILQNTCRGDKLKSDPSCQQFAAAFCAAGQSASNAAGSELCQENRQNAIVTQFCATPGRSHCPSCSGKANSVTSASGGDLAQICGTCSSGASLDPMFSNPAVTRACAGAKTAQSGEYTSASANKGGNAVGGGSSAAGSGGGAGGGGGSSEATLAEGKGVREDSAYGQLNKKLGSGSDDGGGGGFSYGGGDRGSHFGGDDHDEGGGLGRSVAGSSLGGENFAPASDVVAQSGPNVFSIQSTVIRNRCNKGQFMHCERVK